ncbi:hypothetical protein [Methylobacterium oxalidis]
MAVVLAAPHAPPGHAEGNGRTSYTFLDEPSRNDVQERPSL